MHYRITKAQNNHKPLFLLSYLLLIIFYIITLVLLSTTPEKETHFEKN